jgi:hypothetical protein
VLLLTALSAVVLVFQGPLSWPMLHLGNLVAVVVAAGASVALYTRRTDFTA